MALKKPLYDKDGNLVYPEVGIDLDEVVYAGDPEEVASPSPWIETTDIKDGQITTAKVADGAITTPKVADSAITNAKIADNTIESGKIKWSVMKYNFTATSDTNGFTPVPNTVVKPANGFILSVRCTNLECFTLAYNDAGNKNRYTIKCETWNRQPIGNASITLDIIYILLA